LIKELSYPSERRLRAIDILTIGHGVFKMIVPAMPVGNIAHGKILEARHRPVAGTPPAATNLNRATVRDLAS
jgi:hypothetical protein